MKQKLPKVIEMLSLRYEMAKLIGWKNIESDYSENRIENIRGISNGIEKSIPAYESSESDFSSWWYTLDDQLNPQDRSNFIDNVASHVKEEVEDLERDYNSLFLIVALMPTVEKSKIFIDAFKKLPKEHIKKP